jgi:hypothetical protein
MASDPAVALDHRAGVAAAQRLAHVLDQAIEVDLATEEIQEPLDHDRHRESPTAR